MISLHMCIYTYTNTFICMCIYIYIFTGMHALSLIYVIYIDTHCMYVHIHYRQYRCIYITYGKTRVISQAALLGWHLCSTLPKCDETRRGLNCLAGCLSCGLRTPQKHCGFVWIRSRVTYLLNVLCIFMHNTRMTWESQCLSFV